MPEKAKYITSFLLFFIFAIPQFSCLLNMGSFKRKNWLNSDVTRVIIIFLISVLLTVLVSILLPTALPLILPEGKRPGIASGTSNDMTYIDAHSAVDEIKTGKGILVDVRDRDDFISDHPEGAVNIPYHDLDVIIYDLNEIIPAGKIIYLLCEGALCDMSARVAGRLAEMGYRSKIIKQDFAGWKKLNMPKNKGNNN